MVAIWLKLLLIAVGATVGAWCRWGMEQLIHSSLAVWIINASSCLIMGLIAGFLLTCSWSQGHKDAAHLLLLYGFVGGYATFAHYIFYCVDYFKDGQLAMSAIYFVSSLVVGMGLMVLGLWIGSKVLN